MANIHEVDPSQLNIMINKVKEMIITAIINAGIAPPELLAPIINSRLSVVITGKHISINATLKQSAPTQETSKLSELDAAVFSKGFIQEIIDSVSEENDNGSSKSENDV